MGAVADAQDGHPEVVHTRVDPGRSVHVHRGRSAGEDDAAGPTLGELSGREVTGNDLAVDVRLAHPPGDELGVLGPEVDDQNAIGGAGTPTRGVSHWRGAGGLVPHPHALGLLQRLALGLEGGRHHDLGLLEFLDVHVAAGGHGGPEPAE